MSETRPPRPRHSDAAVAARAAALMMPEIEKLWEDGAGEGAEESLAAALGYGITTFDVALDLDRDGWEIDDALLEILMGRHPYEYEAHRDLVKAWVKEHGVVCRFEVGASVRCKIGGAEHVGEVVKVAAEMAQYVVCVAALGHVREGKGIGTHGTYRNDEDLEAA